MELAKAIMVLADLFSILVRGEREADSGFGSQC